MGVARPWSTIAEVQAVKRIAPPGHAAVSWVWLSPGAGTPEAALTGLSPG